MNLVKLETHIHTSYSSSPVTLALGFATLSKHCVSQGFTFCWSSSRRQKREELVGLGVRKVYSILKIVVFSQSTMCSQTERSKHFRKWKLLFMLLWIPKACLLHPQSSSGAQLRVQAVSGLCSPRDTDIPQFLFHIQSPIYHPEKIQSRQDSDSSITEILQKGT